MLMHMIVAEYKLPSYAAELYYEEAMIYTPFCYWSSLAIIKLCKAPVCTPLNVSTTCKFNSLEWDCWFYLSVPNTIDLALHALQNKSRYIGLMKCSYSNVLVLGSLHGVINLYVPLCQGCICCSTFLLVLTEAMYAAARLCQTHDTSLFIENLATTVRAL